MQKTATELYHEFNPGIPLKSPKAKHLARADKEHYGIRWFDKKRFNDFLSLITIDNQEILLKTMFPKTPSTKKYYRDVFKSADNYHKDNYYVFAITTPKHNIAGWIQYMADEYKNILKKEMNFEKNSLVLEVSYAKLFKKNYKNVGVSGLKRSIEIIKKMKNNKTRNIYITGYTDPNNIASEYVLKNNGFEKLSSQMMYINEVSNIWIKKIN